MPDSPTAAPPMLEAATIYLLPEHQIILEELKLKLRRQGIKASKSKLARVAIHLLAAQPLEWIIESLQLDTGE